MTIIANVNIKLNPLKANVFNLVVNLCCYICGHAVTLVYKNEGMLRFFTHTSCIMPLEYCSLGCVLSDSRSPDSSSVSSPPSGQRSPPLGSSAAASMTSLPPISTSGVNSPVSSIGSPFSVISSSLGSPCLPGTPSVGYGPISSPQL
uniref:Nuclear/hormone receptor activator site AF-1 domain-containing protein n=1 Tax=Oryzias sinensis TaxID=183150 RepID=A0A8C7WU02_9TELE